MIIGTLTLLYPVLLRDQGTISVKDQIVYILDFVFHVISIAYSCFLFVKPFKMGNKNKKPSQLTVCTEQATGGIWPVGCSLLTPVAVSVRNYTHRSVWSWVCAQVLLPQGAPSPLTIEACGTGLCVYLPPHGARLRQFGVIYKNGVFSSMFACHLIG